MNWCKNYLSSIIPLHYFLLKYYIINSFFVPETSVFRESVNGLREEPFSMLIDQISLPLSVLVLPGILLFLNTPTIETPFCKACHLMNHTAI